MNFAIRYLSCYRYAAEVTDNLNALRVRPAATPRQRVPSFEVRVEPQARLHRHTDYFGTEVIEFGISEPHREMVIDVRARVCTEPPPDPPETPWGGTLEAGYREAATEFLILTDGTPNERLSGLIADVRRETPLATLMALIGLIPDRFEYRPGVTYVDSTVSDLLSGGAGVCQDFVHLGLGLLRRMGIAARYVSGYLFAAPPDGGTESIEVDTHAWIEALMPIAEGGVPVWVAVDPTNRVSAGERHVKIGHGRDYQDVPPIKGVYCGGASAELEHRVTMALDHDQDPAAPARSP